MKEYTEKVEVICGKKPVFYVIAEPDKFREVHKKRDPILLLGFTGKYWVLGIRK